MTMHKSKITSNATIPNAAVKTRPRYALAYDVKALTQPSFAEATVELGQMESTTKGGVKELRYPQQLNYIKLGRCLTCAEGTYPLL